MPYSNIFFFLSRGNTEESLSPVKSTSEKCPIAVFIRVGQIMSLRD